MGVGHGGSVEKDLVEIDLAPDVPQRANVNTGLAQIDEEIGQALPFWQIDVGPGQQYRPVRQVRPRGPHLLARDRPLVPVQVGTSGQGRQIRSGPRLAEELAPDFLVSDDGGEKSETLRFGSMGEECRSGQIQTQRIESPQVERTQFLFDPSRRGG